LAIIIADRFSGEHHVWIRKNPPSKTSESPTSKDSPHDPPMSWRWQCKSFFPGSSYRSVLGSKAFTTTLIILSHSAQKGSPKTIKRDD
jgi:hypothetical protein